LNPPSLRKGAFFSGVSGRFPILFKFLRLLPYLSAFAEQIPSPKEIFLINSRRKGRIKKNGPVALKGRGEKRKG
jgi:hypothetical protein